VALAAARRILGLHDGGYAPFEELKGRKVIGDGMYCRRFGLVRMMCVVMRHMALLAVSDGLIVFRFMSRIPPMRMRSFLVSVM
jgi:hypothetical protein